MKKTIMMAGGALGFSSATELKDFEPTTTVEERTNVFKAEQKTFYITANDEYPYDYDTQTKKQRNQVISPIRTEPKYQNNEPCICGSGNKYKKCCKNK